MSLTVEVLRTCEAITVNSNHHSATDLCNWQIRDFSDCTRVFPAQTLLWWGKSTRCEPRAHIPWRAFPGPHRLKRKSSSRPRSFHFATDGNITPCECLDIKSLRFYLTQMKNCILLVSRFLSTSPPRIRLCLQASVWNSLLGKRVALSFPLPHGDCRFPGLWDALFVIVHLLIHAGGSAITGERVFWFLGTINLPKISTYGFSFFKKQTQSVLITYMPYFHSVIWNIPLCPWILC